MRRKLFQRAKCFIHDPWLSVKGPKELFFILFDFSFKVSSIKSDYGRAVLCNGYFCGAGASKEQKNHLFKRRCNESGRSSLCQPWLKVEAYPNLHFDGYVWSVECYRKAREAQY